MSKELRPFSSKPSTLLRIVMEEQKLQQTHSTRFGYVCLILMFFPLKIQVSLVGSTDFVPNPVQQSAPLRRSVPMFGSQKPKWPASSTTQLAPQILTVSLLSESSPTTLRILPKKTPFFVWSVHLSGWKNGDSGKRLLKFISRRHYQLWKGCFKRLETSSTSRSSSWDWKLSCTCFLLTLPNSVTMCEGGPIAQQSKKQVPELCRTTPAATKTA